jgi:hypothetical protein
MDIGWTLAPARFLNMLKLLSFSPQDGPGRIPYKGTAVALTDLVAGHVDLSLIQFSAVHELHRSGKARVLAIAADKRTEILPEIPTMAEVGLPEVVSETCQRRLLLPDPERLGENKLAGGALLHGR